MLTNKITWIQNFGYKCDWMIVQCTLHPWLFVFVVYISKYSEVIEYSIIIALVSFSKFFNKLIYNTPVTKQKIQDDNTLINLKECLPPFDQSDNQKFLKQSVRNIVNKAVEMCKNEYQDDISVVMLDIKQIRKRLK